MATLLDYKSEVKNKYSPEIIISDLFNDHLTEVDWIHTLCELELVYGFEVPDELFDRTDLTLKEYAYELSQLPVIPDNQYEEFFDIKFTSMKLTQRFIEIETKTDEESLREKNEINQEFELLTDRLNVLLGNILVN
jgi:hypothetical protein